MNETQTLTIEHSYDNGTTVDGTAKHSTAHRLLAKHPSWMWRGGEKVWAIRSSKRQKPKTALIEHMTRALRGEGYEVETYIDAAMPSVAQQEADTTAQWDEVTARHTARAKRDRAQGEAMADSARSFFHELNGQPVLSGHYSEKADRNRREKHRKRWDKGLELQNDADRHASKATGAAAHQGARYSPETVGNRIAKFEARERELVRDLDGGRPRWLQREDGTEFFGVRRPSDEHAETLRGELAETREHLEFWRAVYAEHLASGRIVNPEDIEVGDWVSVWADCWVPVRRKNAKSVTVPNPNFKWSLVATKDAHGRREHRATIEFHKLSGHRKAADLPDEVKAKIAAEKEAQS